MAFIMRKINLMSLVLMMMANAHCSPPTIFIFRLEFLQKRCQNHRRKFSVDGVNASMCSFVQVYVYLYIYILHTNFYIHTVYQMSNIWNKKKGIENNRSKNTDSRFTLCLYRTCSTAVLLSFQISFDVVCCA